jgi:hypothetical protein
MTKSGVGTTTIIPQQQQHQQQQQSSPEIPIWVSDRKKWVTGISKKTTINDIIYAILKQCHINCDYEYINDYVLVEIMYSLTTNEQQQQNLNESNNFTINSERVLKGNSKVYKYLNKWIENSNKLILKVKKCEIIQINEFNESISSTNNEILDTTLTTTGVSNTNTITKFFKKLTNVNNQQQQQQHQNNSINLNNSSLSNNKQITRYIDVKLPQQQQQQQTTLTRKPSSSNQQQEQQKDDIQLPYKQYDPTLQKTLIVSNILDKDKKLNQQFERVKLLDELIKEAEKTLIINENYYLSNQQFIEEQQHKTQPANNNNKQSNLNLNDVYSCFPEMYTHCSNEVEEFQIMCSKLFNLDDNVNLQKQLLNKLESEVQKELIINPTATNNENLDDLLQTSSNLIETPETVKLKKEVNQSREQTRVQCKELHDLDLRMRQNESVLNHKENELKNLLEELYLHEIYLDSVGNNEQQQQQQQLSYVQKTATLTATQAAKNSKLKTLAQQTNELLSSSMSSTSSASLTPPINEHLINKSSISSINTIISPKPPPLPTSQPPTQIPIIKTTQSSSQAQTNVKTNDHCDNDSGISSMSSENDANLMHNKIPQYIQLQQQQQQQQQSAKSVMETLV